MIQSAETRLDGTTLVVRIPMRFQRRGGRKYIVARDRSEIVPSNKPQADGAPVKAPAQRLALAHSRSRGRRRPFAATSALKPLSGMLLDACWLNWNIVAPPSVGTGMIGASIGLLVAALLILFGLCVVVTAAAWLPDLPPPAS